MYELDWERIERYKKEREDWKEELAEMESSGLYLHMAKKHAKDRIESLTEEIKYLENKNVYILNNEISKLTITEIANLKGELEDMLDTSERGMYF